MLPRYEILLFSFRRNLPPTLGCTPKQPDSPNRRHVLAGQVHHGRCTGLSPSSAPRSRGLVPWQPAREVVHETTIRGRGPSRILKQNQNYDNNNECDHKPHIFLSVFNASKTKSKTTRMSVIITSFWKQQGIQTWISILTQHLHGVSKGSKVARKTGFRFLQGLSSFDLGGRQ
jgi:hypothetical protein